MSFKSPLNIGFFDPATYSLLPRVDEAIARDALIRAGGHSAAEGHPEDTQRLMIAAMMESHTHRTVLGFIDNEFVLLHESGFLMTTIGYGPHAKILSFLRIMTQEVGCEIYSMNEGKIATAEILERLASRVSQDDT